MSESPSESCSKPEPRPSASPQPDPQRPRIVALGGGHGLSTLLRGLKLYPCDLTAIVTVADDGGSSGVLRREMGMLPPGDVRRCIVALAEAEPLMSRLFQYRFGQGGALEGHAFGNLFIAAMMGVTGDFESAISEASRVLAVRGRVLPSTLDNVVLCAEIRDFRETAQDGPGAERRSQPLRTLRGQSQIAKANGYVERVFLEPDHAKGYPGAISALLQADVIVLGPGSLFTSILPNLLVPDICGAFHASPALKVYVCNVATQPGETDGFDAGDHVRALYAHLGAGFCQHVLVNARLDVALPAESKSELVRPVCESAFGADLVLEDLVDERLCWRHDPLKLAVAILRLYARYAT